MPKVAQIPHKTPSGGLTAFDPRFILGGVEVTQKSFMAAIWPKYPSKMAIFGKNRKNVLAEKGTTSAPTALT